MAGKDSPKAVKVPLCLLIQRSNPVGGMRLPKWKPWVKPTPPPRVVTPGGNIHMGSYDFHLPWLRRYFYKTWTDVKFRCRWCNETGEWKNPHAKCAGPISNVINALNQEGHCVL